MSDLISRQAAIDAIEELISARLDWKSDSSGERQGLNAAMCAIEDLPSAQPESSQCWGCNCPKMQKTFSKNADRIRSMTDEELAEFFVAIQNDVADYYDGGHAFEPDFPTHKNAWLKWLKKEVEHEIG